AFRLAVRRGSAILAATDGEPAHAKRRLEDKLSKSGCLRQLKTLSSRLCGGDDTFGREMEIIISQVDNVLSCICLAVAVAGSIYAIAAKELVRRFSLGSSPKCHSTPAVTALK